MRLRMHGNAACPGKLRGRMMENILEFIMNEMPLGTIVYDEKKRVIHCNSTAHKFIKRYGIAAELTEMVEKIFRERHAADKAPLSKDLSFSAAPKGMPANLSIRYLYSEEPYPRISVFIYTKLCNSRLNAAEVIKRYNLTKKEAEILRQLVRGLKNTDIARTLKMQSHTVRDHLRRIYAKCGVKNKLELVRTIKT